MDAVRPRILLVDDDLAALEGLRRHLWKHFDVTIARGGEEALHLAVSQEPFAVVVSDLRMPGMDGIALLSALRKSSPETVRVLLTGFGDLDVAIAAVNEGNVFRFLEKPCPPWALALALQDSVNHHRLILAARSAPAAGG